MAFELTQLYLQISVTKTDQLDTNITNFAMYLIRSIPQGTVDNNLGTRPLRRSKGSRSQALETTNPLIA